MKAISIKPDEKPFEIEIEDGLKPLQEFVGGLIEVIDLDDTAALVINEEGKIYGLSLNVEATQLAVNGGRLFAGDFIVGPALLLGFDSEEGEFCDVPQKWLDAIDNLS